MSAKVKGGVLMLGALSVKLLAPKLLREIGRYECPEDLTGKVVLVTGSSRGLGFLLAREFAKEGCRIVICARSRDSLDKAKQELEQLGAEVLAVQCDVSKQADVDRMIREATTAFGRVDILVNNAGIILVAPAQLMTIDDFNDAMNVMFRGTLYPSLAVLPQMRARHEGRIVNITSVGAKVSVPHLLPYNCAKFATVALSEGMHAELARDGVHVITIVPGLMRTGSHLNAMVKGKHRLESSWFALAASLPLISMDAERAAVQIVRSTKNCETERILTLPANLLARFHGLLPGMTVDILTLVNRFLPSAEGASAEPRKAGEVQGEMNSSVLNKVTGLGRSAARRFNQFTDLRS